MERGSDDAWLRYNNIPLSLQNAISQNFFFSFPFKTSRTRLLAPIKAMVLGRSENSITRITVESSRSNSFPGFRIRADCLDIESFRDSKGLINVLQALSGLVSDASLWTRFLSGRGKQ